MCRQACKENSHDIINMSDVCDRIQDIGYKRRAQLENLKLMVKKSTSETLGITEFEGSHAVRIWHSYGNQLKDCIFTLSAQVFPFICTDQERILSFLNLEEFKALATEHRSISRVLESFEIALEGFPGKNWGVSRALFDSFNDMKSLVVKSPDERLQEFRAVSVTCT
jgi:hypothetical protein